ncbi:MAG: molybdate ABC transporter substrate-binding protein [Lachnospiraceae bacterium]|nr:molybdate ABC transporter substrate-binding protein [Lachnospiraceae bacterium]
MKNKDNNNISKIAISALVLTMAASLGGCKSNISDNTTDDKSKDNKKAELTILAAASLTDVCDEIKEKYEKDNKVILTFSYASSGALQTQIEEGIKADMFMSASTDQMDILTEGGFIDKDSTKNLLENKVVLITSKEKNDVTSFEDIKEDKVKLVGIGNPESVPAGKYAKQVFESLGMWDVVEKKANLGADVRTVLTWVEAGEADCGVVYETDAKVSDKVKIVATAEKGLCKDIIYPVGTLSNSENKDEVKKLTDYMSSSEGMETFKKYGFYECN